MAVRNSKSGKDAAKPPASRAAKARKDESAKKKVEKKTLGKESAECREGETPEKAAGRFVEDLLIRGEAAHPDEHGNLPSGATHEIVKDPGGGKTPKVKRRRFSAY